jgi:GcrA cell cycle regulator
MTARPWDIPGINARLEQLHAEGLSFGQIAKAINAEFGTLLTRNAIIGRSHRLVLTPRPSPIRQKGPRTRTRSQRITPMNDNQLPLEAENKVHRTFEQMRRGDCWWPLGEINERAVLFCAEPTDIGISWCPKHQRIGRTRARVSWE